MKIEDVIVGVDFSPNSIKAVEFAVSLVEGEGDVYLLHVIDSDFVERLSREGFSEPEQAIEKLKLSAEEKLKQIASKFSNENLKIETMTVVGKPFAEILRIANDLDFQMIVVGIRGWRAGDIEELLFGSTAEKIIRASKIPVICVPDVS